MLRILRTGCGPNVTSNKKRDTTNEIFKSCRGKVKIKERERKKDGCIIDQRVHCWAFECMTLETAVGCGERRSGVVRERIMIQ